MSHTPSTGWLIQQSPPCWPCLWLNCRATTAGFLENEKISFQISIYKFKIQPRSAAPDAPVPATSSKVEVPVVTFLMVCVLLQATNPCSIRSLLKRHVDLHHTMTHYDNARGRRCSARIVNVTTYAWNRRKGEKSLSNDQPPQPVTLLPPMLLPLFCALS
jgi:hypothetical protein